VQESGSFHTTQKVLKKSDFLEKSDFSNRVPKRAQKMKKKGAQEIRFFGKIGFLKPCAQTCPKNEKEIRCPRNPIFWKNRISQTVCPNVFKKFRCPRNPIFWKNRISQTVPKHAQKMKKKSGAQEIRFFWKNRISQTVPKHAQKMKKKSVPKKSDFLEKSDFF
jgi:hypothetical protein